MSTPYTAEFAEDLKISGRAPMLNTLCNTPIQWAQFISILGDIYEIDPSELDLPEEGDIEADLYGTGERNIFELMTQFILFAEISNFDKIRCYFKLLAALDFNGSGNHVKKSHFTFLVWYILRRTLLYVPYSEVETNVDEIMTGRISQVLQASIMNNDNFDNYDITHMMVVWHTCIKRHQNSEILVMGKKGVLSRFEEVLRYWCKSTRSELPLIGQSNTLTFIYNDGEANYKITFDFDRRFNLISRDNTPDELVNLLAVSNTDEVLTFSNFSHVSFLFFGFSNF